ncbi:hypothetical protein SASPL_121795 [Salvia splendens]|uniref:Uncharacterized protein n=1 Tax=Salvia splendens TaxID=180675 RepID=A0A8X8XT47_SALSN|nr:hypothetical protein SASPL_121795 [Salvia splendens]
MTDASKDFKFTLKVMIDKKKKKVLFAESDCQFVDVLLSFLTLPLGRIIRALSDHYVEKAPTIGSLSNLYRSLACADNAYFVTEDAKKLLLNPRSPFEVEYGKLKPSICQIVSLLGITNMDEAEAFDVKIGFNQALSILKASLTSTSALTDALLNSMLIKQPKTEA